MDTADLLVQKIDLYSAQVLAREEKLNTGMTDLGGKMAGLGARIGDLEQKLAGGFGGGGSREHKSMGEQLIASEEFKTFRANGGLGTFRFATKAVTSGASSGGALIPPTARRKSSSGCAARHGFRICWRRPRRRRT